MVKAVEVSQTKEWSLEEVATKTGEEKFVVLDDKVYDVSAFIDEHPGGAEVILEFLGKDCTQSFEDVGHSADARNMLKDLQVGKLTEADQGKGKKNTKKQTVNGSQPNKAQEGGWATILIVGVLIAVAAVAYNFLGR